ncbi:MAG: hypothetical protein ABI451_11080 [Dokdonella sp.]
MALECTLSALSSIDSEDIVALQALLDECTRELLSPTLWAWLIGLTIVCVVVGAWIGRFKGRTVAGAVWGAALGPIGWLVVALLPTKQHPCSRCARLVRDGVQRCPACGADQRTTAAKLPPVPPAPPDLPY